MSQVLINEYLRQLDIIRKVSGSRRETIIREAFKDLLKSWGKQQDLVFLAEYPLTTAMKTNIVVDGALLHELRMPLGYWEAKDDRDDLDGEIQKKQRRGYPQDNIIYSDDVEVVLIQQKEVVLRCAITDTVALERLLKLFFGYERPEIAGFRAAVEQFKVDLPHVLQALRQMIEHEARTNEAFQRAAASFLRHAQEAINPALGDADVREMLIQHILTEEIFSKVFDSEFHRENNVARELYSLENVFFTGALKRRTLKGLEPYYAAIRAAAAQIASHQEKQAFLKVIYENFYKVYNTKAADRLGVVYTPNEIVRFMVDGADWLCEQHFGRNLVDKDVDILDPATGTGTFICELLEHFRGMPKKLEHKYKHELHANEVAILPYYVANLNIESTYAAITGQYEEFPNLCFVDTLDNVGLHTAARGTTAQLFGSVSEENVARIRRQNSRRISVIIGNPPYNANQASENDNNKNREYSAIDARIRQTYLALSNAQKTKLYDPYVRFFRWASDRVTDNSVVAFVTNSSFVERTTFDGFRKSIAQEFNEVRIVDLKGNARTSGERRRAEGGNVFGDQIRVGIAIWFCVRKQGVRGCKILYETVRDHARSDEKLDFITSKHLRDRQMDVVQPDKNGNWINQANTDFETLIPLASKETKGAKTAAKERAIFRRYSLGISTNRDEWLYGVDREALTTIVRALIEGYEEHLPPPDSYKNTIKWSETLKRRAMSGQKEQFDASRYRPAAYRPFFSPLLYQSPLFIDRPGLALEFFPTGAENTAICFSDKGARTEFVSLAVAGIADLHFGSSIDAYQQVALYRFDADGNRADNITDWALRQFEARYKEAAPARGRRRKITKEDIFHYCYAVLNDSVYRETYALNLKRELPRIPFYSEFWRWAAWGKNLVELHVGFQTVPVWPLERVDMRDRKSDATGLAPKPLLRPRREQNAIEIDTVTTLRNVPDAAWEYQLGNRCAIEWVLEQFKETKPRDPIIRERFNTYRFAPHKEHVIELLGRVARVSVETVRITQEMAAAER